MPETPKLVSRGNHGVNKNGEIHVIVKPLERFRYGPITSYRIVVIDETDPVPFHPEKLGNWSYAEEMGLKYYIAAEVEEQYFKTRKEFVVGDANYYGDYFNYGPLTPGKDYHVTLGAVSALNNVTKASYARVSHDQHAEENIVVFKFSDDHNHDHHHPENDDEKEGDDHDVETGSDPLAIALSVGIIVGLILLVGGIALLLYLKRRLKIGRKKSDVQQLTTYQHSNSTSTLGTTDEVDDASGESRDPKELLEAVKGNIWAIPRNFLDPSTEVVGRGKFGTVVKATVNKRGAISPANVQVIARKQW